MGKKKRIVDVKNKNNGTARQIKKPQPKVNTNSIEKVAASYDKHHNTSRPCSSIASIIAQEIFPALPQPSSSTDNVTCNYGESPTEDKKCACIYCSLKEPSLLPITTGKLLLTQQPLLAFIILRYLIDERKKVRTKVEEEKKQKEEELRIKTEEIITLLATKSNKKKAMGNQKLISQAAAKKEDNEDDSAKKDDEEDGNDKKKSEEEADLNVLSKEELEGVLSVGTIIGKALRGALGMDDKKEGKEEETKKEAVEEEKSDEGWLEGCDEESSYAAPPSLSNDSSSEDSDIAGVKQILTGGGVPSSSIPDSDDESSSDEEDEPLTIEEEMDLLIDSYIDSKEACDILDNEAKKWANRDLESFVAFLTKKFDNRKNGDKNKPLKLKDILPTISANAAYELLDPVRCRSCRFSATSHLQCLLCDETGRHGFVTKTNNPPPDNDYTITMTDTTVSAMSNKVESGRKGWNAQSSLHLELRPISKSSDDAKYLQVGTALKGSGIVFDYPMNLQDIINLTKHIILPKNTNNEQITSYSDLDDNKLAAIAKEAFESVGTLVSIFQKAGNILEVTVKNDLLRAAAATKNRAFSSCKESCSCYDCRDMRIKETKKILKDCNVNCNLVLTEMSNLLVELFKSTVFVGWSTSISPNLLQSLQNLWDRYNGTLDSLLQPVYNYRNKLLDQNYKLKAHEREMKELDFLKELVNTKIMTVGKLVKDLHTAITEQAGTPNCILVLHVLQSYRLAKEPNVTVEEAIYPDEEGEELFLSLVESRTNLIKRVTGIFSLTQDGAEEARDEITYLNKKAIKLVTSIKNAEGFQIEFLSKRFKVAEHSYYEFDKRFKSDWTDNRDSLITRKKGSDCVGTEIGDSTTLFAQSFWCCMQMLAVFSEQQRNKSSMNSLVLPPRLESWINNTVGIDASQANNFHNTCVGSCGGRRVSSIFSGLIYRWLEERAKEWNAELEQIELFQSMETTSAANAKGGKKKKKKSKKKKAAAIMNRTNSKPDLVESSTNDDMSKSSRGDQSEGIQSIDTDDRITKYNTLQSTSSLKTEEEEEDHTVDSSSRGSGEPEEVYSAAGVSNSPDLVEEDPSVTDLPPTSSVNHMHDNGHIHDDTATLMRTARSRFKEQLISEEDLDTVGSIEPNIRAIQALLTSNEVIYERCRGHIESGTDEKTTFTKADYSVVDAHYDEVTSMFQFVTYPEHCRMEFNTFPLSNLPFSLDFGSFSCQQRYKGNPGSCESSFIDFDILFESSFVLHPDIQGPLLAKLKNHLESVQACLYRINDWLSIPPKNLKYLQESFGEEKLQMSNKIIKHFCVEGSHVHDDICLQCERAFSLHKVETLKIQGMEGHRRLCPCPEDEDLPYFMCSKCDPDSEVQCPHYQVEESYVLREFNWTATFKKGMSYDISTEQGRLQLKNFVSFIEKTAATSSGEGWKRQS